MPKVGDRVIIQGTKIGNPKREGTLISLVGPLINVRWSDGTVSLFKPAAGSVSYETGGTRGATSPAKKPAAKAKSTPKKAAPKKAAPKKAAPKKAAKRR